VNHDIGDIRHRLLIHHVVVFVDVQDMRWRGQTPFLELLPPAFENRTVFFNYEIHRTTGPGQETIESLYWFFDGIEVV